MNQLDWLSASVEHRTLLADLPRARATDPETSHVAAARVKASGHLRESQQAVLEAVRRWPGRTAPELGELLAGTPVRGKSRPAGWWRYEISRRAPELVPMHLSRGRARECTVNHTLQHVWEARTGS